MLYSKQNPNFNVNANANATPTTPTPIPNNQKRKKVLFDQFEKYETLKRIAARDRAEMFPDSKANANANANANGKEQDLEQVWSQYMRKVERQTKAAARRRDAKTVVSVFFSFSIWAFEHLAV